MGYIFVGMSLQNYGMFDRVGSLLHWEINAWGKDCNYTSNLNTTSSLKISRHMIYESSHLLLFNTYILVF